MSFSKLLYYRLVIALLLWLSGHGGAWAQADIGARGSSPFVAKSFPAKYHARFAWDGGTNRQWLFVNSNGVPVQSFYVTNNPVLVSNIGPDYWNYTAEVFNEGNGAPATWRFERYNTVLFSSNVLGGYVVLPSVTLTNGPASGFLRWSNWSNMVLGRD